MSKTLRFVTVAFVTWGGVAGVLHVASARGLLDTASLVGGAGERYALLFSTFLGWLGLTQHQSWARLKVVELLATEQGAIVLTMVVPLAIALPSGALVIATSRAQLVCPIQQTTVVVDGVRRECGAEVYLAAWSNVRAAAPGFVTRDFGQSDVDNERLVVSLDPEVRCAAMRLVRSEASRPGCAARHGSWTSVRFALSWPGTPLAAGRGHLVVDAPASAIGHGAEFEVSTEAPCDPDPTVPGVSRARLELGTTCVGSSDPQQVEVDATLCSESADQFDVTQIQTWLERPDQSAGLLRVSCQWR